VEGVIQLDLTKQATGDIAVLNRLDALQHEVRSLRVELGKHVA